MVYSSSPGAVKRSPAFWRIAVQVLLSLSFVMAACSSSSSTGLGGSEGLNEPPEGSASSGVEFEEMAEYCENRVPQLIADPVGELSFREIVAGQSDVLGYDYVLELDSSYRCKFWPEYDRVGDQSVRIEVLIEVDPTTELLSASDYVARKQAEVTALAGMTWSESPPDSYFVSYEIQPSGTVPIQYAEQFIGTPGATGWLRVAASAGATDVLPQGALATLVNRVVAGLPGRTVAVAAPAEDDDSVLAADGSVDASNINDGRRTDVRALIDFCESSEYRALVERIYDDFGIAITRHPRVFRAGTETPAGQAMECNAYGTSDPTRTGFELMVGFGVVPGLVAESVDANPLAHEMRVTPATRSHYFADFYDYYEWKTDSPDGLMWEAFSSPNYDDQGVFHSSFMSGPGVWGRFMQVAIYFGWHDAPRNYEQLHSAAEAVTEALPGTIVDQ